MPYIENYSKDYLKMTFKTVKEKIYKRLCDLDVRYWRTAEPVPYNERMSGEEMQGVVGESWGKLWDCAWFRFAAELPPEAEGKKIVLKIDISGELLIVSENGQPLRGLTTYASEFDRSLGMPDKTEYPLTDCGSAGQKIEIWADGACNDLFGKLPNSGQLIEATVTAVDDDMKALYYDMEVLKEMTEYLPVNTARQASVFFALHKACDALRYYTPEEVAAARKILAVPLAKKNGDASLRISAVGHAHMDLAWLWPIRETIRKIGRTFATVCRNMEKYPDYRFGVSQAQQLQWLKEYFPDLYTQIKGYIKQGRIELQGGMWVESDGACPSGESFARQLLYGQRFFRDEFGKDVEVGWLPDTFGFPATLPQIFSKAGIHYFVGHRIVINSSYKYHNTFWWESPDGSRVLTHTIPEGTYNSSAAPRALLKTETEYMDKGVSDRALLLYGIGDGGGGPGEEHLERLARETNLAGLPPVTQEFAIDFFKSLEKDGENFHTWYGELFLHTFQGCFSSQSRNKYYNRKMEQALRELEFASIAAGAYPREELDALWKEMLLYQFHDILPGSSIERVNVEAVENYRRILEKTRELTRKAYDALGEGPDTAINSLSCHREEWVCHNDRWGYASVPPLGSAVLDYAHAYDKSCLLSNTDTLENDLLRLTFNAEGNITSIVDKVNNREILSGEANVFRVYEDFGDGWVIKGNYRGKGWERFALESFQTGCEGPTAYRKSTFRHMNSTITQKIILKQGSIRIDFETEADVQDRGKMYRAVFPVHVHTKSAVCEIPFGWVARPTHENTLAEAAQYEVYAHRWLDYSDGGYGVAMLNDGKYGYSIHENALDVTLWRTTSYPGDNGDIGKHDVIYSILPHIGDYRNGVIAQAHALNAPLWITKTSTPLLPVVAFDAENIIVETVKQAEDGDGMIVRVYETYGCESSVTMDFSGKKARIVNILEDDTKDGSLAADGTLHFKPFEVHTIRLS